MRIYDSDQLDPEEILSRDIQAEEDVRPPWTRSCAEVRRGGTRPCGTIPSASTARTWTAWR